MNIININLKKLQTEIEEYINSGGEIYVVEKNFIISKNIIPVLLMSYNTFKILKTNNNNLLKEEKYFIWTLFGCYISIANWLPIGEVEIR